MSDWRKVCSLDELQEGQPLGRQLDGQAIGVFRVGDRCYAVSDICTHEHAYLSEGWQEGDIVECPLHQARFRVTDGKCMGPPAEGDLQTFEVNVKDGEVHVLLKSP